MQTVFVGLLAGFIVGVVCVTYVFLRTRILVFRESASSEVKRGALSSVPDSQSLTATGLMFMAIFGSGSLLWGFIGAGVYHFIRNDFYFFGLSAALTLLISLWIFRSKTAFAFDKMILSAIILVGLGFLIPWMI